MTDRKEEKTALFKPFPEASCNFLSRVSFFWLDPLVALGRKRQIEECDCFDIPSTEKSDVCTQEFEAIWKEKNSTPKDPFALHRSIFTMRKGVLIKTAFFEIISVILAVAIPKIFAYFLEMFDSGSFTLTKAITVCVLLYIFELLRATISNFNLWLIFRAKMGIRAGLMGAMYNKSLVLAGSSREKYSLGKAISIMSSDILRIDSAWYFIHFFWTSPLLFLLVLGLLATVLGKAVLIAVAFILVFFPLQGFLIFLVYRYRTRANDVSDQRLKLLQEIIAGIRVIKYHAWESVFLKRIVVLRSEELRFIRRMKLVSSLVNSLTISFPSLLTAISLSAYYYIYGTINSSITFTSTAYFDILEVVLALLPMAMTYSTEALSSLKRIQGFLRAPVHITSRNIDTDSSFSVQIIDGVFEWDKRIPKENIKAIPAAQATEESSKRKLSIPKAGVYDMDDGVWISSSPVVFKQMIVSNLEISKGELVAIVGPVGSGKSSLLSIIIGEMVRIRGSIKIGGFLGLCPQQAWILNASIRDNILFGSAFDEEKYRQVIFQCALQSDIEGFPNGDSTLVGENGISLSGGQKQRLNLARLAYFEPEIALLDDSFSAVDSHVAQHIFNNCIVNGILSHTTRIVITHNLGILDKFDRIIVIGNGRIIQQGTFPEVLASDSPFSLLLGSYFSRIASTEEETVPPRTLLSTPSPLNIPPRSPSILTPLPLQKPSSKGASSEDLNLESVSFSSYFRYLYSCGGLKFIIIAILTGLLSEGGRALSDIWMKWWLDNSFSKPTMFYIKGLVLLGGVQTVMSWVNCVVFVIGGYFASLVLHSRALKRLLASPISFFDATPAGRILNRFGKDTDLTDSNLPDELNNLLATFLIIHSPLVVVSFSKVLLVVPVFIPILCGYYLQHVYKRVSRQFQRLNILAFAPFLSNYSESYAGLQSLRAFNAQAMFTQRHHSAADSVHRSLIMFGALRRWISFRSEFLGSTLSFVIGLICSFFQFPSQISGLVMSQTFKISKALDWCIKQVAETEISLFSAIRLDEYGSKLLIEAPPFIDGRAPPKNWPSQGIVEFRNLTVRYRHDLPPVLNGVSFTTKPRERIAIVGRTGAGKSTVLNVLYRLIEPSSGEIFIDGVNILELGLADLRSRLAIVPQDPILFSGTLRFNLDPLNEYTDDEIWQSLERVHMKDLVLRQQSPENEKLDMRVEEGGNNFSIGQRQLFCLARALLRPTCILLMDEVTANIDYQTDALVQESLRVHFSQHTIITIAHRINTIIDYDRVMVLRNGLIAEFDSPANLLANPDSLFSKMTSQHK
jgi:ATP-binding cassette, subfamily C (CFTR/MRP), member 1